MEAGLDGADKVWEPGLDFEIFSFIDVELDCVLSSFDGDSCCLSLLESEEIRDRRDRLEGAAEDSGEVEKLARLVGSCFLPGLAWARDRTAITEVDVVNSFCTTLIGDLSLVVFEDSGRVESFAEIREKNELKPREST